MSIVRSWTVIVACVALVGCASGGGSGGSSTADATYSSPPAGSNLAKVEAGMNDAEVRKILGDPDDANAYMTGKGWIPFYYGPDTHRTDWMYEGQGRVVFSRNRWSGGLSVVNVLYNPDELK